MIDVSYVDFHVDLSLDRESDVEFDVSWGGDVGSCCVWVSGGAVRVIQVRWWSVPWLDLCRVVGFRLPA